MVRLVRRRGLSPVRQLELALLAIALLVAMGTGGFMLLAGARPLDALLMTVVTVSTVGYQEVVPLTTPALKLFAISLIVAALVTTALAVRSAIELLFAEYFWTHIGRQRMQNRIDRLSGHAIVCGYGRMGRAVVAELQSEGLVTVVIEPDQAVAGQLADGDLLVVDDDATHDEALRRAGVARARALVAVARSDAVNVLIVLSARHLNPSLQIVARTDYPDAADKLRHAGANYVLHPHGTGATHLALAVTHPVVEDVLNHLLPRHVDLDLSQVRVAAEGDLVGRTVADVRQLNPDALVLALLRDGDLALPPDRDLRLIAGDVLVVAGSTGTVRGLERRA